MGPTPLYPRLDEQRPDDGSFVTSPYLPPARSFVVHLVPRAVPIAGPPRPGTAVPAHRLRVRMRGTCGSVAAVTLLNTLHGADRFVAARTFALGDGFTDYDLCLTRREADRIEDYTTLKVLVTAYEGSSSSCSSRSSSGSLSSSSGFASAVSGTSSGSRSQPSGSTSTSKLGSGSENSRSGSGSRGGPAYADCTALPSTLRYDVVSASPCINGFHTTITRQPSIPPDPQEWLDTGGGTDNPCGCDNTFGLACLFAYMLPPTAHYNNVMLELIAYTTSPFSLTYRLALDPAGCIAPGTTFVVTIP